MEKEKEIKSTVNCNLNGYKLKFQSVLAAVTKEGLLSDLIKYIQKNNSYHIQKYNICFFSSEIKTKSN